MHFVLSALITAALAFSAIAVDINLFPVNGTSLCDATLGFITCSNVDPRSCCNLGGQAVFSATCVGVGLQDECQIGATTGNGTFWPCGDVCNYGIGATTVCVGPRECQTGQGVAWIPGPAGLHGSQPDSETLQAKCEKTVEPDRAVFANGQSFRINYDVPVDVSALLIDLVRADPHLGQGVPEAAAPYEIKAEKVA